MNNKLVSIVIPTYNRIEFIRETLESIRSQTYQFWECILVDDGSDLASLELFENLCTKDNRFIFFKRPDHLPKGANSCRNYGIENSKGAYLMFMDSDDIISTDCFSNRIEEIEKNDVDVLINNTSVFENEIGEKKVPINDLNFLEKKKFLKSFLNYDIPWTIMGPFYKRKVFENHSFDENLSRLQDFDFHVNWLLDDNIAIRKINSVDNYYRNTKNNLTFAEKNILQKKVCNSFIFLLKKYYGLFKESKNNYLKEDFTIFMKFFIINYFYKTSPLLKKEIKKMHSTIYSLKCLKLNKFILLYLFYISYKLRITKIRGGYYVRRRISINLFDESFLK